MKLTVARASTGQYNRAMVDRDTFFHQVREFFSHLDDRPYLQAHPLAWLLCGANRPVSAEALRRVVLSTIEELRPPAGTPPTSANVRYWQCLTLRYSDGLGTKQIARRLSVSERQIRRDHRIAIDAVAGILWGKHGQAAAPPEVHTYLKSDGDTLMADGLEPVPAGDLEAEVTRVTALSPNGPGSISEALGSALATCHGLVEACRAHVEATVPEDLSLVAVNPVVLRQILLCLMSYALQANDAAEIHLAVANPADHVEVHLTIRSSRPSHSQRQTETGDIPDMVDTVGHLVESQGGTLRTEQLSDELRRLVMTLPTAPVLRVLVIDDNPDFVFLFRRYLAGSDYRLVQARTPPMAFELVHTLRPDVITLDVLMPSQDGWQILQQLRADPVARDVPIIICSILPEKPLALSLGATDFLAKPVTPRSLSDALERCRR